MHIDRYLSRNRRDFTAVYRCEHCNATVEQSGYDDIHFHRNVVPHIVCASCGKVAGPDFKPEQPRYAEGEVV